MFSCLVNRVGRITNQKHPCGSYFQLKKLMDEISEVTLDGFRTKLENVMFGLSPENKSFHKAYLSGYLDSLYEHSEMTENQRDTLHLEYCE